MFPFCRPSPIEPNVQTCRLVHLFYFWCSRPERKSVFRTFHVDTPIFWHKGHEISLHQNHRIIPTWFFDIEVYTPLPSINSRGPWPAIFSTTKKLFAPGIGTTKCRASTVTEGRIQGGTRKNRYIPNAKVQNQTRGMFFCWVSSFKPVVFVCYVCYMLGKWWSLDLGTCWDFYSG